MTLGVTLNPAKSAEAARLAADVATFLAAGQKIMRLAPGAAAQPFLHLSPTALGLRPSTPARHPLPRRGVL